MDFFERAHVTPKKENKSKAGIKAQLKNMLNAYKKGDNEQLKSYAESQQFSDGDELKSASDYSDIIFIKKPAKNQDSSSSRTSAELNTSLSNSSSNNNQSGKSDVSENSPTKDTESSVSFESMSNNEEEFASPMPQSGESTDQDVSTFDSTLPSEAYSDSEISIPSSLQSSSQNSEHSDDEVFDPDGELANRILERLNKAKEASKKRKMSQDAIPANNTSKKNKKKVDKILQETMSEPLTKKESNEITKAYKDRELDEINKNILQDESECSDNGHIDADLSEEELMEEDSQVSNSSQFMSVSVSDMQTQSLSNIVGEYVHPTVRNLPSNTQNTYNLEEFSLFEEVMSDNDNGEDLSSLVPEVDEELAIEDLTLETEPQEAEETGAYDDTVQTEDYFEQDSSIENAAPTTKNIEVYNGRNNHVLVLKHPAELYIHGKVKITAIGGSVQIYGYTLQEGSIDLYAPYYNIAQTIKTVENLSTFNGLFSELLTVGLTVADAKQIVSSVNDSDAVITLSKLKSNKIEFVDNNFGVTEIFTKRLDQTPTELKKVAASLECSLYLVPPKRILEELNVWEELVACGKNPNSRGIICGGKGLGKSTLLRYYINRLLAHGPVLVIDLDPGQAEFTVPGNVSATVVNTPLIGPNFTHLRRPEKMLNVGMINTMDNTARYLSAVKEIINHCQSTEAYHSMPWIVNTMGMTNNMGLKFITYTIVQLQPTFVYQIDSKIPKKRFEIELQANAVKNYYEEHMRGRVFRTDKDVQSLDYTFLLGVSEESSRRGHFALKPRDERYLNVLAYFAQLPEAYGKSLLQIVPYEVSLSNLSIGFNVKIKERALTKVINGKIVALCQLPAADKRMFILADKPLLCHGYGLIRGIDFDKHLLYILTPLGYEELKLVNTLVYADWMPELSGQESDELPQGTMIPYRTATEHQNLGLMSPPKRRFNPIQLLKATRTS